MKSGYSTVNVDYLPMFTSVAGVKRQFGVVPALIVFNRVVKPLTVAVSVEQNLV
jgi:hypothetical protein